MSMSVETFHSVLAARGVPRDVYTTVEGYFAESLPALGSGERAALGEFAADHPEWNFHRYMTID
jgi:hypothetical protein